MRSTKAWAIHVDRYGQGYGHAKTWRQTRKASTFMGLLYVLIVAYTLAACAWSTHHSSHPSTTTKNRPLYSQAVTAIKIFPSQKNGRNSQPKRGSTQRKKQAHNTDWVQFARIHKDWVFAVAEAFLFNSANTNFRQHTNPRHQPSTTTAVARLEHLVALTCTATNSPCQSFKNSSWTLMRSILRNFLLPLLASLPVGSSPRPGMGVRAIHSHRLAYMLQR